jgi:hypothetical protein
MTLLLGATVSEMPDTPINAAGRVPEQSEDRLRPGGFVVSTFRLQNPSSAGWGYNIGNVFMPRPNRSAVGVCIAVIALAAFLPGISLLDCALFEPQWVFLPDETPVAVANAVRPSDEQPVPLLSLVSSRGPPSLPLA